ncbi:MAG: pseudoazurin [Alphaproteobacteria bacterium]|nr:pseudoazurin [Alphaproteobacteria bacterium]
MNALRSLAAAIVLFSAAATQAATFEVKEVNAGPGGNFVFDPGIVRINVGDVVKFIATDMNDSVNSIRGGIPAVAAGFASRRSVDYWLEFTVPGIYAYECTSHRSLGMVGLIIVGNDTSNLAAVQKLDLGAQLANQRLTALVAQISTLTGTAGYAQPAKRLASRSPLAAVPDTHACPSP